MYIFTPIFPACYINILSCGVIEVLRRRMYVYIYTDFSNVLDQHPVMYGIGVLCKWIDWLHYFS